MLRLLSSNVLAQLELEVSRLTGFQATYVIVFWQSVKAIEVIWFQPWLTTLHSWLPWYFVCCLVCTYIKAATCFLCVAFRQGVVANFLATRRHNFGGRATPPVACSGRTPLRDKLQSSKRCREVLYIYRGLKKAKTTYDAFKPEGAL